jgi:Fe-S-cluster containining protein
MIPLQVYIVQNGDKNIAEGKSCEGCVSCCDGNLSANIFGYEMGGADKRGCHLLDYENKKCGFYKDRPQLCRDFQCEWLVNKDMPAELKPSVVDNVVVKYTCEDEPYLYISHKYEAPNQDLLDWMIDYCNRNQLNLAWWEHRKLKLRGTKQWVRAMKYTHSQT